MANYNLTQTGAQVQQLLDTVAAGYIYMGTADLTTTPDTTNPNVCYLLSAVGTYTNFGNITHASGIGIALWNGSAWSYQNVPSSAVVSTDATPTGNSTKPVQSGGVWTAENILSDAQTIEKITSLTINSSGKFISVSETYWISYYTAIEDETVRLDFTRGASYTNDGRIVITTPSNIAANNTATVITQVADGNTYTGFFTLQAGQCIAISARSTDTMVVRKCTAVKDYAQRIESNIETIYSNLGKYPKEGVNLINLSKIIAGTIVDGTTGAIVTNSQGWRTIEIDFCATDVPIYMNNIYSGYYSLINSSGEVIKVVGNSNRDLFNDYKLPSGTIKGRFSINSSVSDSDISSYAYISYGRPLMQDEINTRVSFENSYTLYPTLQRPTDYNGGDIAAFDKILCIGDSITRGYFNYTAITGQTYTFDPNLAYPANLARITGAEVTNLGESGVSSSTWWTNHQNDEALTGCKCVIIELGINDTNSTLDTTTKTAFDNIISALKTRNQKVKIFISGIPSGKGYKARLSNETYYQKDQWLKTYYNTYYAEDTQVFFIDIARYTHLWDKYSSNNYDDFNQGHLSAYGYWMLARDYANYISYIMHESNKNFRDIQFIGTNFSYE